jgi:hypothetical protein
MPVNAKADTPLPVRGATADAPAMARVGRELARFVLWIVSGSILVLLTYLLAMDLVVGSDIATAYARTGAPAPAGAEIMALSKLDDLRAEYAALAREPTRQMSSRAVEDSRVILETLDRAPSVDRDRIDQLKECASLPTNEARAEKLMACNTVLANLARVVVLAAGREVGLQMASESADRIDKQRQALHQFWLQAAQLVLLNLLLPLLTALLGYIFGTQQSQNSN